MGNIIFFLIIMSILFYILNSINLKYKVEERKGKLTLIIQILIYLTTLIWIFTKESLFLVLAIIFILLFLIRPKKAFGKLNSKLE